MRGFTHNSYAQILFKFRYSHGALLNGIALEWKRQERVLEFFLLNTVLQTLKSPPLPMMYRTMEQLLHDRTRQNKMYAKCTKAY